MGRTEEEKRKMLTALAQEAAADPRRQKMEEGERYFSCRHDVLNQNLREKLIDETEEGGEKLKRFYNPNRSNFRVANPFHRILVTQKTAFLVNREPSLIVTGEGTAYQQYRDELSQFADEKFGEILYRWVVGASNKGVEYVHVYYDDTGKLDYCIVPAEEITVLYDEKDREKMTDVIRFYESEYWENGVHKYQKKAEWWTKDDVTYYTESGNGSYHKVGDSPHWNVSFQIDGKEVARESHGWGRLPFIPLKNNEREESDLTLIKGLVDAYDLISSEGTNNLLDLVDLYWVIRGYGGEAAGSIAKKLAINKAVHIDDSEGGVEAKQVQLPVEARIQWLNMLRRDIFHFGMGVDTDNEDWQKAPSGVALKMRYSSFKLKAGSIAPYLRKAIGQLCSFVAEDLDRKDGGGRSKMQVQVILNESDMSDDLETVQIINLSKGLVSDETLLGKHPFVRDVNAERKQLELEKKEEQDGGKNGRNSRSRKIGAAGSGK